MSRSPGTGLALTGDAVRDAQGFNCSHGVQTYLRCWKCDQEDRDLRREDDMRETFIAMTLAFNRVAEAVERMASSRGEG